MTKEKKINEQIVKKGSVVDKSSLDGFDVDMQISQSYHEGPIPSARELEAYQDICPGSARDIIDMAISQNNHTMDLEKRVMERSFNNFRRGQFFGFLSVISGFILSGFLGYIGHPGAAATVASASLVGIVTVFITGRTTKKESKE